MFTVVLNTSPLLGGGGDWYPYKKNLMHCCVNFKKKMQTFNLCHRIFDDKSWNILVKLKKKWH